MAESLLFDRETLRFYDGNADVYAAVRPDKVAQELLAFLPRVVPGGRILELGCGSGGEAAAMIAMGFAVDATDGSAAMAALASARLGTPVRVMRFEQLDAPAIYDAVVACASLLHVLRDGLPDVLARIGRALKPGGWHFATYKTAAAPGRDRHGRYYNRLAQTEAEPLYRASASWESIDFQQFDADGYFGEPSRWLSVTARKSA